MTVRHKIITAVSEELLASINEAAIKSKTTVTALTRDLLARTFPPKQDNDPGQLELFPNLKRRK